VTVGAGQQDVVIWIAQDDSNPTRRISFGDNRERAEQLAESLVGGRCDRTLTRAGCR
jgi:hypothetical protein